MNLRAQIFCTWSGIIFMLLFLLGWVFAASEFFPPHQPSLPAGDIVEIYQTNTNLMRFGLILLMLSGGFYVTFSAALADQLLKIHSPLLAIVQMIGGTLNALLFVLSPVLWGAASYRLDRNPEITQAMNDFGWFLFFQPVSFLLAQTLSIAYVILTDKSAVTVFPRWVGFLNIWVALIFIPSLCISFFKSGPFAWNGLICFWLPVGVFGIWVVVMMNYMLKDAKRLSMS